VRVIVDFWVEDVWYWLVGLFVFLFEFGVVFVACDDDVASAGLGDDFG